MQLTGIHHLTAVTAKARGNQDFYTRALGMRLVKKLPGPMITASNCSMALRTVGWIGTGGSSQTRVT